MCGLRVSRSRLDPELRCLALARLPTPGTDHRRGNLGLQFAGELGSVVTGDGLQLKLCLPQFCSVFEVEKNMASKRSNIN